MENVAKPSDWCLRVPGLFSQSSRSECTESSGFWSRSQVDGGVGALAHTERFRDVGFAEGHVLAAGQLVRAAGSGELPQRQHLIMVRDEQWLLVVF